MKWEYLAFMHEYSNDAIEGLIESLYEDEVINKRFGSIEKAADLFAAYYERLGYHKEVYDIIEHAVKRFIEDKEEML